MSPSLHHALSADARPGTAPAASARPSLVVAGGGGALGSAVLEQLIGSRQFSAVRVLVTKALRSTMAGVEPLDWADADDGGAAARSDLRAELGLIVFDRRRHANGREQAFLHATPDRLQSLAARLRAGGVRDLIVVSPHASASLPQALKDGLHSLDEHAVVRLEFEHLVFVRPARAPTGARSGRWLQRVADGVLAQLRVMTPQPDQPVRARKVAQFVAELAHRLAATPPGTRIVPPELVWLASQQVEVGPLVDAWLHGHELPAPQAQRRRM